MLDVVISPTTHTSKQATYSSPSHFQELDLKKPCPTLPTFTSSSSNRLVSSPSTPAIDHRCNTASTPNMNRGGLSRSSNTHINIAQEYQQPHQQQQLLLSTESPPKKRGSVSSMISSQSSGSINVAIPARRSTNNPKLTLCNIISNKRQPHTQYQQPFSPGATVVASHLYQHNQAMPSRSLRLSTSDFFSAAESNSTSNPNSLVIIVPDKFTSIAATGFTSTQPRTANTSKQQQQIDAYYYMNSKKQPNKLNSQQQQHYQHHPTPSSLTNNGPFRPVTSSQSHSSVNLSRTATANSTSTIFQITKPRGQQQQSSQQQQQMQQHQARRIKLSQGVPSKIPLLKYLPDSNRVVYTDSPLKDSAANQNNFSSFVDNNKYSSLTKSQQNFLSRSINSFNEKNVTVTIPTTTSTSDLQQFRVISHKSNKSALKVKTATTPNNTSPARHIHFEGDFIDDSNDNHSNMNKLMIEDTLNPDVATITVSSPSRKSTVSPLKRGFTRNIEEELLNQRVEEQRKYTNQVSALISSIQNNAMENYQDSSRLKQSKDYRLQEKKSKGLLESSAQKTRLFQENLRAAKERNEFEGKDIQVLETEFATGGKFNQKNYNNLKINKSLKRSKQQVQQIFKNTIKLLQRLNIDPAEVVTTKIFSSKPFEKENSYELFQLVKANQTDQVAFMLKYSKYLVHDYDYLFMTSLHWASKRGYLKMAEILLHYNSDIDAEDIIGRTPLFFAIEGGHEEVVELLLVHRANPYKTKYVDYVSMAKSYVVQKMLAACRKLHWSIKLNSNPNKAELWKKEINVLYLIRAQQQAKDKEIQRKHDLM